MEKIIFQIARGEFSSILGEGVMAFLRNPYVLAIIVLNAALAYFFFGRLAPSPPRSANGKPVKPIAMVSQEPPPPLPYRDYTLEELLPFDGVQRDHILLAVDQRIYDVTSARHYYGAEGSYGALRGRDASRGLATHSIPRLKAGQVQTWDTLNDLTVGERESLNSWVAFFDGKYPRVGTLVQLHSWAGSDNEDRDSVRGAISHDIELPPS